MLKIEITALKNVLFLTPERFGDERGWFSETWNEARFAEAEIELKFVKDNHSPSFDIGTLRGLHYRAPPHARDKLVRCSQGSISDVAVDARRGYPTFGRWLGEDLSANNGRQLFVPKGFLHGFVALGSATEVQYKVPDYFDQDCDGSVRCDSLSIDCRLPSDPILSLKDMHAFAFKEWISPFKYEGKS